MRFPHAKRLLKCSLRLNRMPFGPRKECFVADDPPFRSRGTEFLGDVVQPAFRFRVIAGKKRKPCVQIGNIAVRFEIWRKRFQGSASGCEIALHQLHIGQFHPKKVRLLRDDNDGPLDRVFRRGVIAQVTMCLDQIAPDLSIERIETGRF